jgi:hypothetical protein
MLLRKGVSTVLVRRTADKIRAADIKGGDFASERQFQAKVADRRRVSPASRFAGVAFRRRRVSPASRFNDVAFHRRRVSPTSRFAGVTFCGKNFRERRFKTTS